MEYKTRQELNDLSLRAFGTSSRWQKLVNKGIPQAYERDRQVMVVEKDGSLGKKLFTDRKVELKRFTIDEVKTQMVQILEDRANAQKKQAEALAAAAAESESAKQGE